MSSLPAPKVSRRPRVPLIWVVPVVAVFVAVWLLAREWQSRGEEIDVEFTEGAGIEAGRTKLQYKGVSVGLVKAIQLKPDFSGVRVRIQLDRSAGGLARTGSQFWIVHPEIDFSGIRGIEALVGGVHLRVRPGDGPPAREFRGLDQAPAPKATEEGPAFLLHSDRLGNVHPGAPVFYRDIRVGSVETSQLSPNATETLIRIRLLAPYAPLVRTNSRFWNAGGLPLQISLFGGGRPRSSSIASFLTGAIAFATPDELEAVAEDGAGFKLHAEADNAWLNWRPEIPIDPEETAPGEAPKPADLPDLLGGTTAEKE